MFWVVYTHIFKIVIYIHFLITSDSKIVQKVTNHPVHIVDEDGSLSPTALIPFCDFGNNMSAMGVKIDQFSVPVCYAFKPKIFNDKLCYELDLNKYTTPLALQKGIILLISYNEDRQFYYTKHLTKKDFSHNSNNSLSVKEADFKPKETIHLGTKGKMN